MQVFSGMMTYPQSPALGARRSWVLDWLRRGLDLLFPPRCVGCSRIGEWFCNDCWASVEPVPQPICPRCGRSVSMERLCQQCQVNPAQLDGIRSVALHDGALRKAIHHFKYQRRRQLATMLGEMLFTYWQGANLTADLAIPVPLHKSRQKERGYNQAGLLAGVLAQRSQLPLDETHLIRTRATRPQVGLGVEERRDNVSDAFSWTGDGLEGIGVLLVDDVCTTGATLEACALALRNVGVASVWALTLARPRDHLS
jgi:ComF family protein